MESQKIKDMIIAPKKCFKINKNKKIKAKIFKQHFSGKVTYRKKKKNSIINVTLN